MAKAPDVHDLAKGQIGFVCSRSDRQSVNYWMVIRDIDEIARLLSSDMPRFETKPLMVVPYASIPHGTPVIVTSIATALWNRSNGEKMFFYRILWNELDCWVRRENIVNPYFNGSPFTPPT